jgi:ATP-dependent Clp protease ATP-binding subunit ClpX
MWVAAPDAHCSFCGKTPQAADYLVRGLVGEICSECVELCEDIIAEETVS